MDPHGFVLDPTCEKGPDPTFQEEKKKSGFRPSQKSVPTLEKQPGFGSYLRISAKKKLDNMVFNPLGVGLVGWTIVLKL